jgi:hypothetical protein
MHAGGHRKGPLGCKQLVLLWASGGCTHACRPGPSREPGTISAATGLQYHQLGLAEYTPASHQHRYRRLFTQQRTHHPENSKSIKPDLAEFGYVLPAPHIICACTVPQYCSCSTEMTSIPQVLLGSIRCARSTVPQYCSCSTEATSHSASPGSAEMSCLRVVASRLRPVYSLVWYGCLPEGDICPGMMQSHRTPTSQHRSLQREPPAILGPQRSTHLPASSRGNGPIQNQVCAAYSVSLLCP